ncbi:hypothetical protein LWI28_009280 [Acer negundo]|uniref:At2g29880-like C-terminal domain-containing protein n=1 Tax=Acer negundo TaxID=4023 RepID=A0AAD5NYU5_ACENE|nr:hypothetical protein LWI28_009280 [Acer negundo]
MANTDGQVSREGFGAEGNNIDRESRLQEFSSSNSLKPGSGTIRKSDEGFQVQRNQLVHQAGLRCDENITEWAVSYVAELRASIGETVVPPSLAPPNNTFDESFQPPSPLQPSSPFEAPLGSMFNKENTGQRKRNRSECEGSSKVLDNLSIGIDSISTNFERIYNLMEKRERDGEIEKGTIIWDALKDIPDLDDTTRFRAVELLNIKTKKDMFFKMTPEEQLAWILFNLKFSA